MVGVILLSHCQYAGICDEQHFVIATGLAGRRRCMWAYTGVKKLRTGRMRRCTYLAVCDDEAVHELQQCIQAGGHDLRHLDARTDVHQELTEEGEQRQHPGSTRAQLEVNVWRG